MSALTAEFAHSHDGGKTWHKGHTHWTAEVEITDDGPVYPHEGKTVIEVEKGPGW